MIPTIGIVNLVSDLVLQKSVSDDLVDLIGLERRLVESGLDDVRSAADVDWSYLVRGDRELTCFVLNPEQFRMLIWPRILEASKDRLEKIEIILPELPDSAPVAPVPDGPDERAPELEPGSVGSDLVSPPMEANAASAPSVVVATLASRVGYDEVRYRGAVRDLAAQIESEWKATRARWPSDCSLTLRRGAEYPRHAFLRTPPRIALVVDPIAQASDHVGGRVFIFKTDGRHTGTESWLTDSLEALRPTYSAPLFSDDRSKGRNTERI
ncbi:hypothetical protein MK786_05380 [Microbacterium sp. CFH 31415]|uniref:hypothetical protein n=1 Tax=Microbacterium sp. CFH 31415 TaxID=2921732 RepID=UPI001F1470A7|nr:hypothetical protein [Microbacterium sp. CFH 31415]MCH6230165.1 hypothetical protein [Microbacterium sp. CFH 31415]